jgi:hypothetical protein
MSWLRRYRLHIALMVVGLAVFGITSGKRLAKQSSDPHFVYLADAWLNGKLSIDPPPERGDDWSKVETVELQDGTVVRGRKLNTRPNFHVAGGGEIPKSKIKKSQGTTHYVSFPPFPAVLMLPQTVIHGRIANDVFMTVLIAALVLPLAFAVLRRLKDLGLSERSVRDDLWLVACLGFGTVFYFSAVQGRVWFMAHVIAVALCLAYVWCSLEARHPLLAGLCLGLATMTRTPMAFLFPLFAFEAWRMSGGRDGMRDFVRRGLLFAAPVLVIAIIAVIHNVARFDEPLEFGHSYLAVRQQRNMETMGMFSHHYLARNLAVAFTLLPDFSSAKPYISINGHGLAMWFTTPVLFLLLWPKIKGPLHRPLWITVALVAVPTLLYQNSGWLQFGYRFSLDYMVLLILLLAVGGRPLTRIAKGLIIAGIVINLFGAFTFARYHQFYKADNATYNTLIKH